MECFDPGLAAGPTRRVAVERIVDLLAQTHAPERIDEYRRAMAGGDRFPPISVLPFAGRLYLTDGHKRLCACRALGAREIPVEVWTLRRWAADQLGQGTRKITQIARLLRRLPSDPSAPPEARRLWTDTVGHWRRILASLRIPRG